MNEDIIIALKNGIERGEDLQNTMQILVNSGYNPAEVQEASKYVQIGVTPSLETKPDEELLMPEQKKGLFSRKPKISSKVPIQEGVNQVQQIKQEIASKPEVVSQQLPAQATLIKKPKKELWMKEIILFGILLVLTGVLIALIFFKDKFLAFFS